MRGTLIGEFFLIAALRQAQGDNQKKLRVIIKKTCPKIAVE